MKGDTMLKLSATLINVYKTDEYKNDQGEVIPSKNRFQLMLEKMMRNGSVKKELIDISVKPAVFVKHKDSVGKVIELEVGYFGKITFFGI
jgi:hypothetical protein